MSHHAPYYAQAPLGQAPVVTAEPTSMVVSSSPATTIYRFAGMVAGAALAYHGYKRNNSIGWALAWSVFGGMVWPIGLGIAYAQGFGKPGPMRRNRRRSRR